MDIASLIHYYGYPIFLLLAIVEGPIATVVASFLASVGFLNVFIVFVIAIAGDIIGDLIYYRIGFAGRKKFLNKEKFLGFSSHKILKVQEYFKNHGGKTLLLGKLTHGVGFTILIASGVAEMPLKRFLFYTILGTIPKVLFFLCLGFYFGKVYVRVEDYLGYIRFLIIAAILLLVLYFLMKKLINRHSESFKESL